MKLKFEAGEPDAGRKVYHILKNALGLSAGAIKRLKAAGAVTVNGETVFMDRRVEPGDVVETELGRSETAPDFPPERRELEILFENQGLLAINKPAGLLAHPSRGKYTGTAANFAAGYLLETAGSAVCHAVNRLDRDTSGVMLFAKNAFYKARVAQSLRTPEAEKEYLAYLCGELPEVRGVIDLPIEREREGFQKRVVRDSGKRAVTEYEILGRAEVFDCPVTKVRLTLRTGRTHQIRVHCAYFGAPVLGDRLYGTAESLELSERLGLTAHLLHARRLCFAEPMTGDFLTVEAPITRADMIKCGGFFEKIY